MENENTQIVKPPKGLSFLMYLFLMVLVWCFLMLYDATESLSNGILMGHDTMVAVSAFLIDIFMYVYGVVAIYKTLQRKTINSINSKRSHLGWQIDHQTLGLEQIKEEEPFKNSSHAKVKLRCHSHRT